MRLIDRVFSEGFVTYDLDMDVDGVMSLLAKAQPIMMDNVAEYYFSQLNPMTQGYQIKDKFFTSDFPNVMLPFEFTYMEFRLPQSVFLSPQITEIGVLANMFSVEEGIRCYGEESRYILGREGAVYCANFWVLVRDKQMGKIRYFGGSAVPVNAEGGIVSKEGFMPFVGNLGIDLPESKGRGKEFERKSLVVFSEAFLFPCFLGLSFMHCRNVKMVEEIPPPKLSKKHEKKGNQPLVRYHVLKIDHMKSILEREGHASTEGLKKALHICRGHFATYGKDGKGKLFGKHEGRFWIPMHMRGNPDHGVVDKTYDVH